MRTKYLTITKYVKNIKIDKAKNRIFPHLRGTWLPSFDIQADFGIALNWFSIRVRCSTQKVKYTVKQF